MSDERAISFNVHIRYVDSRGRGVTGLRPIFALRSRGGRATFAVVQAEEGPSGNYRAWVPAYRYAPVSLDYEWFRPHLDTAGHSASVAGVVLGALVTAGVVSGASLVPAGVLTLASMAPGAIDKYFGGGYTDVPYPSALGQEVQDFEVCAVARDARNTTEYKFLTYDELYRTYVSWGYPDRGQELDFGTVTVDTSFACDESGKCLRPESGYRVYIISQIGPGQLEVLPEGSENEDIPLCRFAGGGLDCTIMAELEPLSEPFPTEEEAVKSLCPRVANLKILPLGVGPAADLDGTSRFLGWTVYDILRSCGD